MWDETIDTGLLGLLRLQYHSLRAHAGVSAQHHHDDRCPAWPKRWSFFVGKSLKNSWVMMMSTQFLDVKFVVLGTILKKYDPMSACFKKEEHYLINSWPQFGGIDWTWDNFSRSAARTSQHWIIPRTWRVCSWSISPPVAKRKAKPLTVQRRSFHLNKSGCPTIPVWKRLRSVPSWLKSKLVVTKRSWSFGFFANVNSGSYPPDFI